MEHLGYYTQNPPEIWVGKNLDSLSEQLVLIHELTHIFRLTHNSKEDRWLNEGLAKFLEYKFQKSNNPDFWPVIYNNRFKDNPVLFLSNNKNYYGLNGNGYVSSFILVYYLYKHYGGDLLIRKMLNSKNSDWDNIRKSIDELRAENHISIPPSLSTSSSILLHLSVALWLNDPTGQAQFELFHIDQKFEPPISLQEIKFTDIDTIPSDSDALIIYHSTVNVKKASSDARKKIFSDDKVLFSISNYFPFKNKFYKNPKWESLEDLNSADKVFVEIKSN